MKCARYIILLGVICFAAGCSCPKKAMKQEPVTTAPVFQETVPKGTQETGTATYQEVEEGIKGKDITQVKIPEGTEFEEVDAVIFEPIHFDFDKYNLKPSAQAKLQKIGRYLLDNPAKTMIIEGHCDERGTREYNLVLGEQRSLSARRFLIVMGVSPSRLFTVSYGEDQPADPVSNEGAWAKNRRCEFLISRD